MLIVDTHVHVALHTYDPIEMLLTQMQYNNVDKTTLVQSSTTTDNTYVIECKRRFPQRVAVVCRVDVDSPHALADLEHWHREGADSVRLRNFHRSPGSDPLAIWRKAEELGMPVSAGRALSTEIPWRHRQCLGRPMRATRRNRLPAPSSSTPQWVAN